MLCLRCGYCCIAYDVIIISPEFIQPKINFDNPNLEQKLIHKKSGEICPHLIWDGDKAVCKIHHYEWYEDTPCFQHGQIESSAESPCRLGEYFKKEGICIRTRYASLPIPIIESTGVNIAKCLSCGYQEDSINFPVEIESELQGQIHCPKCGSENVEI